MAAIHHTSVFKALNILSILSSLPAVTSFENWLKTDSQEFRSLCGQRFLLLSAISPKCIIKDRCLAPTECVFKRENNREMRRIYGWLIEWIFFFSLGKYLFCLCTKMLIITAPFWKPFHWSVRSWAGATRSLYGPSPLQRSEPLQVQESNTYPGTKEISQQGRTTGGNCSPAVPPTLLMTLIKKTWEGGLFVIRAVYISFLCCDASTYLCGNLRRAL